jgi:hypothetical protein
MDEPQGLAVTRHPGGGWQVVHTWTWRNGGTGLPATGKIRYKRDARQAMAELCATGCDFTASPDDVRRDPAFQAARAVGLRRGAGDGAIRLPGLSPICYASRNADGTIHATNTVAMAMGSDHVHDEAGFKAWQDAAPEVEWLDGAADCTCGGTP